MTESVALSTTGTVNRVTQPAVKQCECGLGDFPMEEAYKKYWNSHVAEENVRGDPLYSKIFTRSIEFLLSARTFCRSIYQ